jgi:Predicted branched-chain amino acid permease (azaleucine resistance)
VDDRRERFLTGVRLGLGPAAATVPLGMTFGAFAVSTGWGSWAPIVASALVFAGSAQFAAATVLAAGGGGLFAVVAGVLMNARFVPMGLALGPWLRGGRVRRALEALATVDASWAAAHVGGGRFDRLRLFGATLPQYPAWVGGTALGVLAAPSPEVITAFGLDVIFPAFFLTLLIDELRGARTARRMASAALGALITGVLLLVAPVGVALLGAAGAAVVTGMPAEAESEER